MARHSWELLDRPDLCRCLLFARPITFAAREVSTMTILVKLHPSIQSVEARHELLSDDRATPTDRRERSSWQKSQSFANSSTCFADRYRCATTTIRTTIWDHRHQS